MDNRAYQQKNESERWKNQLKSNVRVSCLRLGAKPNILLMNNKESQMCPLIWSHKFRRVINVQFEIYKTNDYSLYLTCDDQLLHPWEVGVLSPGVKAR